MSIKKWFGWASGAQTVWGFLPLSWQAPVTAALTAVTAYFGFYAGGVFYALVGGAIVFTCALVSAYVMMLSRRTGAIFEQIGIEDVGMTEGGLKVIDAEKNRYAFTHVALNCFLKNNSERTAYVKLKREHHSLGNQINPHANISDQILIIPAKGRQQITFATLPDVEIVKGLKGRFDVVVDYGPSRDNLQYEMDYRGELMISLHINKETKSATGKMNCIIKQLTHTQT